MSMTVSMPKMPRAKRRWATEQTAAHSATTTTVKPQASAAVPPEHRAAILERASLRRWPWTAAATTAGLGAMSWGFTALFATAGVGAAPVAGTVAGLPLAIGFIAAWKARDEARWIPDIAAGAAAAAGFTFWCGMTGWSWWHTLVLLVGTVVLGARWWNAHPVGPGIEPLWEPADTEIATATEVVPESAKTAAPEPDLLAELWEANLGGPNKRFAGSYLTDRQDTEYTTSYTVQLVSGDQTYEALMNHAMYVASGLQIDRTDLVIEPPTRTKGGKRGGADTAKLTVITTDPVAEPRLWSGPRWNNGRVEGLGRYIDGSGEVGVKIFDHKGSKRLMIVGDSGGGKSAAANTIVTSVMSSGLFNLIYIDPKGNSSAALRGVARVAIIGKEAASKAPQLMDALRAHRSAWSTANGKDLLLPSASFPGLFTLHDEVGLMAKDHAWANAWGEFANIQRSLGIPIAGMNQYLHESYWGGDRVRSAFAQQVVAFRISSKSDDLVPGLEFKPRDLPVDEHGETIPGFAVHVGLGRRNVPALWDWLPTDSDLEDDPDFTPPYRTSTAFETFFKTPDLHPVDVAAIESILGPAINGRWVVGPGGSHQFEKKKKGSAAGSAGGRQSRGGFGASTSEEGGSRSSGEQCRPRVLALIEGGTTRRAEIIAALPQFAEKTVDKALSELVADGEVCNTARGVYEV
ncbi:hypothetical protein ABT324_28075 [Saccharopolyspora sp. NPDC000359]|uniref:hypothetical protein n=1 Tax=Saccharopolyspora sp. NPDC000359 TaxID=3154251 RepID=UPI0033165531